MGGEGGSSSFSHLSASRSPCHLRLHEQEPVSVGLHELTEDSQIIVASEEKTSHLEGM